MKGFTFYRSFYDTIKKIRNARDREKAVMAICEYMFEDKLSDSNLPESVEIALQSFMHTLNKSKKNGANGSGTNCNRNAIETQSNEIERETRLSSSLRLSSITPPFIPPQGEKKSDLDVFCEKYPKFDKAARKAEGVDFGRLLKEFEQSSYLRSLYTFKQVLDVYPAILNGDFRDKPSQADVTAERAKRERFYAERQQAAQNAADKVFNRFMQDEEFKRIHKRLRELDLEIAKTEVKAEQGDTKAKKEIVKLTQEQGRLRQSRIAIIERNGLTEDDLLPKWHCKKCADTGYLPDGKMCDCYKGDNDG